MRRRRRHSRALFCRPAIDIRKPTPAIEATRIAMWGSSIIVYR
jgi:hypothetical protein